MDGGGECPDLNRIDWGGGRGYRVLIRMVVMLKNGVKSDMRK